MKEMNNQRFLIGLALALASLAGTSQAQVANGSFETGALTGWTTGGTGRVAVLENSNVRVGAAAAPMPAVPHGSRFVALSTGPGTLTSNGSQIDGNSTNDFDVARLSTTVPFSGRPAVLVFDWNFASSEANASPPYDDFFDVRINNVVVFSGSVFNATNNTSNYPDVPVTGRGTVNWNINLGVLNTVQLTQGVGPWRRACLPIAAATSGSYNLALQFQVADQGDGTVDSTLMLDNVRVQSACDASPGLDLAQITNTSGSAVEVKGSGFVFRPVDQRLVASNRNGGTVQVFVSSANLATTNPSAIEQVVIRTASGYSSVAGLAISAGGQIQGVDISDDGAWIAIAARETPADNLEIYRYQRSTAALVKVTNTSGCENRNPVISEGSTVLAFESTCASLTSLGSTRKVVYARFSGATPTFRVIPAGNCTSRAPTLSRSGKYIAMESTCNPPGRSNGDGNMELFAYDAADNGNANANWRQVTNTTGSATFHFGISLNEATGNFSALEAVFISSASLVGSTNSDGSTEVYRWVGNSTQSNNGTLTQVTTNTLTGKHYTQVALATANDYFSFERIDAASGSIEVGTGRSTTAGGGTTVVAIGGNYLGLGVAETTTHVLVPFVAAEDFTGTNADGNYELFQGSVAK